MGGHGVEGWIRTNKWGAQSHRALDAPRLTIPPLPHILHKRAYFCIAEFIELVLFYELKAGINTVPAMASFTAPFCRVPSRECIIELNSDHSTHIDYANDRPDIPDAWPPEIITFIYVLYAVSHYKVGQCATPPIQMPV